MIRVIHNLLLLVSVTLLVCQWQNWLAFALAILAMVISE
jgi:hypothetical protein